MVQQARTKESTTTASKRFFKDLSSYLVDVEFNEVDKRKIVSMFDRHQEVVIMKQPLVRREKKYYLVENRLSKRNKTFSAKPNIKPEVIIEYIERSFDLIDFHKTKTRKGMYPYARFMAMVIMDKCTHLSLEAIGSYFLSPYTKKTFDHTSVIHGIKQGKIMIDTIPYYADIFYNFLTINNINDGSDNNISGQSTEGITGDTGLPGITL